MLLESFATLRQKANAAWEKNAQQNRRVVLFHALPALALPLIVMAINLFLEGQLAGTGGLSGIGMRSTLETIQTVLSSAIRVLLPFWQLGLIYIAIQISRGQEVQPQQLLAGFSRWGAALRLMLFRTIQYTTKIFVGIFLGSAIYSATPLSGNLMQITEELSSDPAYAEATLEELMIALTERLSFWDIFLCYGLCILGAAVLVIPVFYRYRMSDYVLLDSEKPGAFAAIRESTILMHGNRVRLFKLDLHFWWYYLLLLIAGVAAYGDLILPILGVRLPFSAEWAYMLFAVFSTILQLILYYLFRGQVETAYACVYDTLKTPEGGNETL